MDLQVYLKCILCLILCIWQSESVNSMECELGNLLQKPEVGLECYPLSDFHGKVKEKCQFFSCKQNETVDWKVVDPKKGQLQVQMQALPFSCGFEWYDVDLEVYDEKIPLEESLMCDTSNTPWKTHSKRTLEHHVCSNCSVQSSEECVQIYFINFKYVYPGAYRLKITPYVKGSTRQAQRSYRMNINSTVTNYVKKNLTDLNLNASLQYRSVKKELDLGIPLLIDNPPDEVKIEVKFSYDYIHLYGIKYGNENSSSIVCEEKENFRVPSCQVQKSELECKFYNMTQGFYGVHVHFNDDRCKKGTVWINHFSDPCHWIIKKNITVDEAYAEAVTPNNESTPPEILYTIILVVILIGVIIMSYIAKKVPWRRHSLANGIIGKASENVRKSNAEQTYNFNNGNATRFNFGQLLTLSERPRPEVLLVYTRETQPFMDLVSCLRRVLDKICKCQVYDYFDPELWNDVSEDPKGWVHALIVERQAKVIIIASEVAAIRHRSLMGEFPTRSYKSPHPFDPLFLYALRLLRDTMDEESYKNHFVVTDFAIKSELSPRKILACGDIVGMSHRRVTLLRHRGIGKFDGFTESNHILEYFNPYTRFVLPKHLNKLFEHLHDPDTTMHFDTNRLEERYEVRQLRLQLEHLKNLKLLAKSDVDTHKLYDW